MHVLIPLPSKHSFRLLNIDLANEANEQHLKLLLMATGNQQNNSTLHDYIIKHYALAQSGAWVIFTQCMTVKHCSLPILL